MPTGRRLLVYASTIFVWLCSTGLAMHLDAMRILARPELVGDSYSLRLDFQYLASGSATAGWHCYG